MATNPPCIQFARNRIPSEYQHLSTPPDQHPIQESAGWPRAVTHPRLPRIRACLGACHQVSKRDDKTLTPSEYKALQKRYRTILTQGARELPPIPPRQNGQRGKVAKSDAHNLWERMQKHEIAVLRFAKHPDVAFTNNRAERDLRMAKVKQKVSGCFRTRKYAEAYCRIKLSAVHGEPGLQPAGGHSDRSRRACR